MKLGYSTWGMPTVPIDTALRHLAELGYQGVEITVIPGWITELSTLDRAARRRIVDLAKQYNLALPAIAAHTNLLESDPARHAQNMNRLKGAVDLAVDWAIDGHLPCIDTTPGGKPEDYEAVKALLVERLNELVDYAKPQGVTIALEPHVGAAIDTPQRVLEILQLVNSPYLKLNFDISHFNVMGYSIEESVAACGPHSVHTHIKDERGTSPNHQF